MQISTFRLNIISEIKGQSNGKDVVICTNNKTYEMKKVENSNTLMLVEAGSEEFCISARIASIYEVYDMPIFINFIVLRYISFLQLNLTNPRLNQIKETLKSTEYCTDDENLSSLMNVSNNDVVDKYDLFAQVQASSFEIASSLIEIGVVEVNNKVKLIAPVKYRETVRYLLDTILENSWSLDNICEEDVFKYAPHVDVLLLRLVLGKLGQQSSSNNNNNIWMLCFDKVAKASAHDLFISHTKDDPNRVSVIHGAPDDLK
jgi:hypothetical protein